MIEIPESVVDYFGRSNLPTFWLIQRLIEEDSELSKAIRQLFGEIDVMLHLDVRDQPLWLSKLGYLPHESKQIMGLSHLITTAVATKRLSILSGDHKSKRLQPYNHPDLEGVELYANSLVKLSDFDTRFGGLRRGSSVFEVLPSIASAINSMYWANRSLVALSNKIQILVRIDPLMVQYASDYKPLIQKMWVYGKDLDWNEIKWLRNQLHMRWQPDQGWQEDVEFTDLVWSPSEDGIHFICEEFPKMDYLNVRGSRYCHGIYVPALHSFIHCDGAMRLYTPEEHDERRSSHVRKIGKIGRRIKIYQIDAQIPVTEWTSLVGAFFVWNNDVSKYFGTTDL